MNIANKISFFRIGIVPFIWLLMLTPYDALGLHWGVIYIDTVQLPIYRLLTAIMFLIACFSDFLDGYLARKYQMVSDFGKLIDPIADKLLVNSLLIILVFYHDVPVICVLIMITRDLIVDAIRMHLAVRSEVMEAGMLGKLKTVLQMLAIFVTLLHNVGFETLGFSVHMMLIYFATLISVISGTAYLKRFLEKEGLKIE